MAKLVCTTFDYNGTVFTSPEQVIEHPNLDKQEKIRLLTDWAYDLERISASEEENMISTDSSKDISDCFTAIKQALHKLSS